MGSFDKIAKKADGAAKKTTKIAATVTDEVKAAVDLVIQTKAEVKRLEAEQEQNEQTIRDHVRPQQDEMAYCGQYAKSFSVEGNTGAVTYTTSDKFSVPQEDEAIDAIKKLLGAKFNELFTVKRTISVKAAALSNEATLDKMAAACKQAGLDIGELFDVVDKVIAQPDLDAKQYELKKEKLEQFRALVRQAKAAIK
jgi:hypothetical protein